MMKKFAILYNSDMNQSFEVATNLENTLKLSGISPVVMDLMDIKQGFDFVFVIGGDGTLLNVARFYSEFETPVFGINLGRLGFLSQSKKDELSFAVEKILNKNYRIEDRLMLSMNGVVVLNDFVIKGCSKSRTSRFYLRINDKFVCDYLADGLIISTPTGSTAYGLSAGGPVLSPMIEAFVIVPICPHTLTARPLVIPADEKISISTCDNCATICVSADGQEIGEYSSTINIEKSKNSAKLALLDDSGFYSVLRDKLQWGVSPKS